MAEDPAATLLHLGPGLRQRVRQRPQRLQGADADGQPGRRARGDAQAAGRAADQRHRGDRAAGVALAGDGARRPLGRDATRRWRWRRRARGGVATLVLPADAGWDPSLGPPPRADRAAPARPAGARRGGRGRRRGRCAGRLARRCCSAGRRRCEPGLRAAARIAAGTGARVFHDTFAPRLARGGVALPRAAAAVPDRDGGRGAAGFERWSSPARGRRSGSSPTRASRASCGRRDARSPCLATPDEDAVGALEALADLVGAEPRAGRALARPDAAVRRRAQPRHADRGRRRAAARRARSWSTRRSPPPRSSRSAPAGAGEHDYLFLTGGAIGWGLPAATGAAIGAPGRPGHLARGRRLGHVHASRRSGPRPASSST